jgi:hypothetical protein
MTALQLEVHDVVGGNELKQLAGAEAPCITIAEHISNPLELPARLKNMIRAVQKEIAPYGGDHDGLLNPIQDLAASLETGGGWANTLVILRSPDTFRHYWMRTGWKSTTEVGGRFQLRPFFELAATEQRFHLLVLNQKHVRLYHVTPHRMEETDLQGIAPTNLNEFLNTRQPDHTLANRSTSGPSMGAMKGAAFGMSTDRDREDESLRHFFVKLDRGVSGLLRGSSIPLVLAGAEHEIAMYRGVNTYPRLAEETIRGAGFSGQELHDRGWDIGSRIKSEGLAKALADFERHGDKKRLTSDPRKVVSAAFAGRVDDLFFTPDAQIRGKCDGNAKLRIGQKGEDLVNAAALETVRQGGRAFQLRAEDMPVPENIVAALRF